MSQADGTRINKFLSESGFCSRRAGDKLVTQGRVAINGVVAEMGSRVGPTDAVTVDGESVLLPKAAFVYLALNKPAGIVCTTDTKREKANIIDFVNYPKRIFPVGRLDKASQGLIFLTNDGDIVNQILRARNNHEKEYIVKLDRPISPQFLKQMGEGVPILDTVTRPCEVEAVGSRTLRIVLTQGLNRQIRRMCEALGYRVRKLKRVRIMNVLLDIPIGAWRDLTEGEMRELRRLVSDSSKTAPADQ
jgi:23S rRNA pseudouridine2604 synthase